MNFPEVISKAIGARMCTENAWTRKKVVNYERAIDVGYQSGPNRDSSGNRFGARRRPLQGGAQGPFVFLTHV